MKWFAGIAKRSSSSKPKPMFTTLVAPPATKPARLRGSRRRGENQLRAIKSTLARISTRIWILWILPETCCRLFAIISRKRSRFKENSKNAEGVSKTKSRPQESILRPFLLIYRSTLSLRKRPQNTATVDACRPDELKFTDQGDERWQEWIHTIKHLRSESVPMNLPGRPGQAPALGRPSGVRSKPPFSRAILRSPACTPSFFALLRIRGFSLILMGTTGSRPSCPAPGTLVMEIHLMNPH